MKTTFKALALTSIAFSALTSADTLPENDSKFGVFAGFASGGDTVAEIEFTDGSDETVKAGSGVYFGLAYENKLDFVTDIPLYGHFAFAYLSDSVDAENGSVSFTRFPVDALLMTKLNQFSFAGGATYHLAPSYEQDLDSSLLREVDLDNALGLALEANYTLTGSKMNIGLRYTNITYTANGYEDLDGSGFAISVGAMF